MFFFFNIQNEVIDDVDTVERDDYELKVEADNPEDIFKELKEYSLSENVENKITEIFDKENESHLTSYNIKHWVSNRSFGELIDMYENGEITRPEMQREFVWDAQKSSRLIESILIGLPIPPLFFLEVGNSKYEVIDGLQRLITVTNFVTGKPWVDNPNSVKKIKSRLSGKISVELKGKSFEDLDIEQQRIIKRSTIPLIEFRQINPDNVDSKYMIFERINSGSEKLNPMQIRKSLAYGSFIQSLYKHAENCSELKNLFTISMQKKDSHVEALLRIYAMSDIYFNHTECNKNGLKYILNSYCEDHRNVTIDDEYAEYVSRAINYLKSIFDNDQLFKRVTIDNNEKPIYSGNINVCILEAMVGVCVHKIDSMESLNKMIIKKKYETKMNELAKMAIYNSNENPFSTSTGTIEAINRRFKICEEILA